MEMKGADMRKADKQPKIHSTKWLEFILLKTRSKVFKQNVLLYVMFAPLMIYFIVFKYIPMFGIVIAFKDYNLFDGIWGSPWAGLKYFEMLLQNPQMLSIVRNTFVLSFLSIIVGFPVPIIVALLLNEVQKMWYKRSIQTLIYLPHFLNWVIVGGIVLMIFGLQHGILNRWMEAWTGSTFPFLYQDQSWMVIFLAAGIWKGAGWGAIIYLAALTAVDHYLYEAASLDGANKWRQIWHITLPAIRPTIIIMLILQMGQLMEVGFDQVYVLGNSVVSNVAEVISTYSYRIGLGSGQFSIATALGLFESLVGLLFVLIANQIARKFDQGLW